jgi:hypothetical protein
MPLFKSTYNILVTPWEDEVFDPNWMDSDKLVLPPKKDWDYLRELTIEDVDIWEVIYESGGGTGVYASWSPYAEFYMVLIDKKIETFYGKHATKKLIKYLDYCNIPYSINKIWVEPDQMHLYE